MSRITFTIHIDVPDGAQVATTPRISLGDEHDDYPTVFVPPFADELIPLPDGAQALPQDVQPFRGAAHAPAASSICPVHREPWKLVPAGVSKASGKAYTAFLACPVRGCTSRPAA